MDYILIIVLFLLVFSDKSRLKKIEEYLKLKEPAGQPPKATPNWMTKEGLTKDTEMGLPQSARAIDETGLKWLERFFDWLREDWLLKLGALLLLIGFGWFVTYAFLNNWIGPMGRIALGIIAGAAILVLGWWRIKQFLHQGGIFLVLGSTVILLTIFAAREIYDFFTPAAALLVMFLSTAFVALASVKYNSKSLSLASLILAGIAPLLTSSPAPDYVGLFAYLLVVVLGAIWVVSLTGQRELTAAALILVAFYSVPHLFGYLSGDKDTILLFIYAFTVIFFTTNTFGILKLKDKTIVPDLVTTAGNGLLLLVWIMYAVPEEWRSLVIAAWTVVFLVGAFLVFRITQKKEPFYIYAGVGVAMLAAATAAELSGAVLTIAYTIEGAAISYLAYYFLRDTRIGELVSLLLVAPIILSFSSLISNSWLVSVFNKDFFVLLILGAILMSLGYFFLRIHKSSGNNSTNIAVVWLVLGSLYFYALLWLSVHAYLINEDTATMLALIIYTVTGLAIYFYGRKKGLVEFIYYGGLLLGFVVARLLFVEVWRMELTGRIITFFLVGLLLVSTAFLGREKRAEKDKQIIS